MTPQTLHRENQTYQHSGGVSPNNRDAGFHSAFRDNATGRVYLSRFGDGRPAPLHLLDGLPDELIERRDAGGRVVAAKQTVIAGFLRADRFYTRRQAARVLAGSNKYNRPGQAKRNPAYQGSAQV